MSKRLLLHVLLLSALAGAVSGEPQFSASLSDIRTSWDFLAGVLPCGLEGKFYLKYLPSLPFCIPDHSSVVLKLCAGYEEKSISRDDATGEPDVSSADYASPNFQWELTYNQGLIGKEKNGDLLKVWSSWHGRVDGNLGPTVASIFPDRNGTFINSIVGGVTFDSTLRDTHGIKSGLSSEVSCEWGPTFLSSSGTDFVMLEFVNKGYVPLFDLSSESNLFSGFLAFRFITDYTTGTQVPLFRLNSIPVRGTKNAFDTALRSTLNSEVRLNLPSVWGKNDIMPMVIGFVDLGCYYGYNDVYGTAASRVDDSGFLASAGALVAVCVLDFAYPSVYVAFPLYGETKFKVGFKFKLQF